MINKGITAIKSSIAIHNQGTKSTDRHHFRGNSLRYFFKLKFKEGLEYKDFKIQNYTGL